MHSSGRGEDSPEPYRGVVLPSAQHQSEQPVQGPYGEQVRPAGGSPWGGAPADPSAFQAQPRQQAPETADATQMLPPYPGTGPGPAPAPMAGPAGPPPVADATQMLPPYPGMEPGGPAGPQQGPGAAPVPPLPPMPPQAPPMPPTAHQAAGQPGPYQVPETQQIPQAPTPGTHPGGPYAPQGPAQPPDAADATQALPLSIFEESKPYEQQYPQQGYGQEFGDGQPQQQAGPQHDSDYDHLFRSDVPGPAPIRQRIIQPPSQQQHPGVPGGIPAGGPQQFGQQGPPYGQQGYDNGYAYDDEPAAGGRRRLSPKVLIGIVVAGCVVAGLVVGGLLNSGGKASADNAGDKSPTPSAGASAPASGTAGTTNSNGDNAAEQQAKALDSLLKTSGNSRASVVNAVESIKNCGDLPGAASALRSASGQRNGLITQLGSLSVDKLPNHGDLTAALTKAWQASSAADSHYANWAGQAQHDHKICKGGHARSTNETLAANRESGTATQQKKRAVRLWNAIARQYGLTQRQFSQL